MCVGVPGQIMSIEPNPLGMTMGKVNFGGIVKEICLAYEPGVQVGDYVLVHAGFAMSKIDEQQALDVFDLLRQMDELAELETKDQ
jgi:hydrogenase expression/formation protein HypC